MVRIPWLVALSVPFWPAYLYFSLSGLYIFALKHLYYPYIGWMWIASGLGYINTRIILAIAYYLRIVPIGLIMQWRNGLEYKHKESVASPWKSVKIQS